MGQPEIYMGYFASMFHPEEEHLGCYFPPGTCIVALETHALLRYLWSIFCKWTVINVTILTFKIAVYKKTNRIFFSSINEIVLALNV